MPVAPDRSFLAWPFFTPEHRAWADDLAAWADSELPAPGGFTLRVPGPSLLTDIGFAAGDRFPAVADGYFLFLKPLKPGEFTLSVRMVNPDQPETGVNYTLIIGGSR